jgi:hypothetical protein
MHDMVRPVLGRTEAAHIGDDDSVAIVGKRGCDGGIGMGDRESRAATRVVVTTFEK